MQELDKEAIEKKILLFLDNEGELFPHYSLIIENGKPKVLGKGGFSTVYEMYNKEFPDIRYALKVAGFQRHTVSSKVFQETAQNQLRLCEKTNHVVNVLDAREICVLLDVQGEIIAWEENSSIDNKLSEKDGFGVVKIQLLLMEKLEQLVVKSRFDSVELLQKQLTQPEEITKLAIEIGCALHTAHSLNILHRDVKLENIFWDRETGVYKLGDFGISKHSLDGNAETTVFTNGYGAPEIELRQKKTYNATADIYSLGITLYLLWNDLKFPGSDGYFPKVQVQYSPDYVFPAPAHASVAITKIIRKMCSYDPEDRHQSMAEVLSELEAACKTENIPISPELLQYEDEETVTFKQTQTPVAQKSHTNTRYEKLLAQRETEKAYRDLNVNSFTFLTLFLTALLICFSPELPVVKNWLFWTLPIAVFLEAFLQKAKEFHVLFGALVVGYIAFSIYQLGVNAGHILLLIATITGFPIITAAGAVSTAIFTVLAVTDNLGWFDFLVSWDITWIVLAFLLLTVFRHQCIALYLNKAGGAQAIVGVCLYSLFPLVMLVGGIVLFILEKASVLQVPEVIQQIHPIRTYLAYFVLQMFLDIPDSEDEECPDSGNPENSGNEETK